MATSVLIEAPARLKNRYYHPELDVLRFAAASAVIMFHALDARTNIAFWTSRRLPHLFAALLVAITGSGGYGVDLFFALSSFLITQLLLREREQNGNLNVRKFYMRRILRIWPLYFFFIGIAYAFTFVSRQRLEPKFLLGLMLLYGNWVFAVFGPPNSVAGALWTVTVEEQFYLSWPQVVKRASVETIARVAYCLIAVAFVVRVMLMWQRAGINAFWFNTFARLDPFAMGILMAIYIDKRPLNMRRLERFLLLAAGLIACILVTHYDDLNRQPSSFWGPVLGYPIVALGCVAILVATYDAQKDGFSILKNRTLIYLGKISYGIYVYHELGLYISHHLVFGHARKAHYSESLLVWIVFAFGLTICFASISYKFLESPFLRLKDKYARVKSRPV